MQIDAKARPRDRVLHLGGRLGGALSKMRASPVLGVLAAALGLLEVVVFIRVGVIKLVDDALLRRVGASGAASTRPP